MQAAVRVLLRDGDHETQVCLDHLFLRNTRLALTFLNGRDDTAEVINRNTDFLSRVRNLATQVFNLFGFSRHEAFPLLGLAAHILRPVRVEFVAEIGFKEITTRNAMRVSQTHQLAFKAHQTLVDGIELLNERFDTRIVEVHGFQVFDDLVLDGA